MRKNREAGMSRRHLLRAAIGAAGATAAVAWVSPEATAQTFASQDKRRPRYQANSAEVRNFYRVNRYPAR